MERQMFPSFCRHVFAHTIKIIERTRGLSIRKAVFEACQARLRSILVTTLPTILGLVPLALFGGAIWFPMAWAIMGGLG